MESFGGNSGANGQPNQQYPTFSYHHYGNAPQMQQAQQQQTSNQMQQPYIGQKGQVQQKPQIIKPITSSSISHGAIHQSVPPFPSMPPPPQNGEINNSQRIIQQPVLSDSFHPPTMPPPPQRIHLQSPPSPLQRQQLPPPLATTKRSNNAIPDTLILEDPSVASTDTGKPVKKKTVSAKPETKMTETQLRELLQDSDWRDRTIWLSKILMGGQSVNGFLKSTSAVQRIKRQRARQLKIKPPENNTDEPQDEEVLKKDVMISRTAKKFKSEFDAGMEFCKCMHDTIRGVLQDLDGAPQLNPLEPPHSDVKPPAPLKKSSRPSSIARVSSKASSKASAPTTAPASAPPTAAGVQESTLRKSRKKKLPPNKEEIPKFPETDSNGKRLYSKKQHTYRIFEWLRFRSLRKGELVAARISSRDLWILARVVQDYTASMESLPPVEFLQLTEAKREQLFKEKVMIQDVEDDSGQEISVQRSLVLPLPRHVSEAADWGSRCKKGFRVYAMYPQTTSLYTATVVDNTTFCRGDDDIIVVEFDGDEPDETGSIPKCHIPARFVTLIPREFPGANTENKSDKSLSSNSKSHYLVANHTASGATPGNVDMMGDITMDGMSNFGDFDDLEFDLGLS